MKRTPLYPVYENYPGVKIIDFGGWELPVNFDKGIIYEHEAVRNGVGLFDVSHMGEILIEGAGSEDLVDWLVTNNVKAMKSGQVLYALMCYPHGGVVDDLIIYKYSEIKFLLVVNASNIEKDFAWISFEHPKSKEFETVSIKNVSNDFGQLALQGPKAESVLESLIPGIHTLEFFNFKDPIELFGKKVLISRTGYTGEDGFEIYCSAQDVCYIWENLLISGRVFSITPCGLGARDTLRMEAKLPLYGHEISDAITPLEANLSIFVVLDEAGDFCGKSALLQQKQEGIPRTLRGIKMIEKGVPRQGYSVFKDGQEIGFVTSGAKSPTLGVFCGYVLISRGIGLKFGDTIDIQIHGKNKTAELVKTPFYKNTGRKK